VEGLDATVLLEAHASAGAAAGLTLTPLPVTLKQGEAVRVVARVTDAGGNPVRNALVVFSGRGGALVPAQARSDDSGRATVQWKTDRGTAQRAIMAKLAGTRLAATQVSGSSLLAKKKG
jgi:Bacterial Ig-like domain (group 1)